MSALLQASNKRVKGVGQKSLSLPEASEAIFSSCVHLDPIPTAIPKF